MEILRVIFGATVYIGMFLLTFGLRYKSLVSNDF